MNDIEHEANVEPMMGDFTPGCVYNFEAMDDGLEIWHCDTHDDYSIGNEVSCEKGMDASTLHLWELITVDPVAALMEEYGCTEDRAIAHLRTQGLDDPDPV